MTDVVNADMNGILQRGSISRLPGIYARYVPTEERGRCGMAAQTAERISVDIEQVPDRVTNAMCRTIIGSVRLLFNDPAVQAEYKRWQESRREKERNNEE